LFIERCQGSYRTQDLMRIFRKDPKLTAIGKVRSSPPAQPKTARGGRSGDGVANAMICIAVMLACVIAVVLLA